MRHSRPRHLASPLVICPGRQVRQEADRTTAEGPSVVSRGEDAVQRMTRWGIRWLSSAAEDPEQCRATWRDDARKPYLLPTGSLFDVVVVDQRIGIETFDQLSRRRMPHGSVMADWASGLVGFFLPPRSRERFARLVANETDNPPKYRYLDRGSYVVVPGPQPLSGDRYVWLAAPTRCPASAPIRRAALAVMLVASASLVERAERYGEEQRWEAPLLVKQRETGAPGSGDIQ